MSSAFRACRWLSAVAAIICCTSELALAAVEPDETPPSAPRNLTATAVSVSQIDLAWTAASDPKGSGIWGYDIYRCQGASCVNWTFVTTTSYADTGLAAGVTYTYQVRAIDLADNVGPAATASATTFADVEAPSAPGGLNAAAASSTQIDLSWTASTDNVGVTGYGVEQCQGSTCTNFAQIATLGATTYSHTGLAAATTYRYRVRASDAVPNYSAYSPVVSVTTPAVPDTQAPSTPDGLTATAVSNAQVNLSWTASSDNVGVTGYLVERCQGSTCTTFTQIAAPTATTYSDTGLTSATTYRYRVRARDAAPNYSSYSAIVNVTTQAAVSDTAAPTAPASLAVTGEMHPPRLSWSASSDNVGVAAYLIERCLGDACTNYLQIGTSTATSYTDSSSIVGESYRYRVRARDAAGNLSGYSNAATPCD